MSGRVEIRVGVRGHRESAAALGEVERAADRMQTRGGLATSTMVGVMAGQFVLAGIARLRQFASSALDAADATAKAAQKSGISAAEYQRLAYAARLSGSSMLGVETAMRQMQVAVAEGSKEVRAIGLDLDALQALSPDEQFLRVADAVAAIQDPAERTRAAVRLFGREGQNLLPMIRNLRSLRQEADRLGLVLSESALAAAERFNDTMERLKMQAQSKIVVAVEYVEKVVSGEDPQARAEAWGVGAGAVGGAIIGARVGGASGAKWGAAIGATVTSIGQQVLGPRVAKWTGADAEMQAAIERSRKLDAELARRNRSLAALDAPPSTPNLDRLMQRWEQDFAAVSAYLEKLRREAVVAREAGEDAAETLRRAWEAATGESVVPNSPAGELQVDTALTRFGFDPSGDWDWEMGAEIQRRRIEAERDATQDYLQQKGDLQEQIRDAETRLHRESEAAADRQAREGIAAERRRLQERAAAAEQAARESRQRADSAKTRADELRERVAPSGGPDEARRREREQRDADRAERRLELLVADARRREAELVTAYGSRGEAREHMTRRGRELLEYDDSRRVARRMDRAADRDEKRAEQARKESERRGEELRREEIALGRQRITAEQEVAAELRALRGALAALQPPAQTLPAAPPASAVPAPAPAAPVRVPAPEVVPAGRVQAPVPEIARPAPVRVPAPEVIPAGRVQAPVPEIARPAPVRVPAPEVIPAGRVQAPVPEIARPAPVRVPAPEVVPAAAVSPPAPIPLPAPVPAAAMMPPAAGVTEGDAAIVREVRMLRQNAASMQRAQPFLPAAAPPGRPPAPRGAKAAGAANDDAEDAAARRSERRVRDVLRRASQGRHVTVEGREMAEGWLRDSRDRRRRNDGREPEPMAAFPRAPVPPVAAVAGASRADPALAALAVDVRECRTALGRIVQNLHGPA